MIPTAASILDNNSVTATLTGPKTLVMKIEGRNVSILHGELMGLITALALSNPSDNASVLYTDHLNSVCLIDDSRTAVEQQTQLHGMNGHTYYQWILMLTNTNPLKIVYTPGHSTEVSEPAHMNFEAAHYASSAQRYLNDVPVAPIPTFFMDDFTLFSNNDRWIKLNIHNYVAKSQIQCAATLAATTNHERMVLQLYDPKPPTRIFLYARARFRAPDAEWDNTMANELITCTNDKLAEKGIEEISRNNLLATVKSLFTNNASVWPLQYSAYFLGHIPKFDHKILSVKDPDNNMADKHLAHHLAADWHLASIRLAGRIWGDWQQAMVMITNTHRRGR
ncbi:hypothetical protein DFH08DRAFT_949882 [Mycena albidolilacea]|uniref:Uncharacterized protein n=1 Tax=Mycena albidolilacea TaxID=1033008 RepID=A0AAD7APJ2_9AGAR|nr:hypothetical protein DFH08DRAFT_949882 [Mycena albidolilacea]